MQGTQQDFESLTLSELFDEFEKVDDIAYPEKATRIYCMLISRSGKTPKQLCLHYQELALKELIGSASILSGSCGANLLANRDVVAKITRMQMMI